MKQNIKKNNLHSKMLIFFINTSLTEFNKLAMPDFSTTALIFARVFDKEDDQHDILTRSENSMRKN